MCGEDVLFRVSSEGSNLSYRWYLVDSCGSSIALEEGSFFGGVTTDCLTVKLATCDMTGEEYRCVVTGANGSDYASDYLVVLPVTSEE